MKPATGISAFRAFLLALPAEIDAARERGQPIAVEDPGTEHGRRLLETLGVTILAARDRALPTPALQVKAEHVPADFRRTVALELQDAARRARELMPLPKRAYRRRAGQCAGCAGPLDAFTPGCRNCSSRRSMRATLERRRLTAATEARYPPPISQRPIGDLTRCNQE